MFKRKKSEKKKGNNSETVKEKNNEKNDFLELVKKYRDTITPEDLKLLLEKRLELPSKFLITTATLFITLSVALILPLILILQSVKLPFNGQIGEWISLIPIFVILAILYAFLWSQVHKINLQAKQRGKDEKECMEQYLQAKKRLEEIRPKEETKERKKAN